MRSRCPRHPCDTEFGINLPRSPEGPIIFLRQTSSIASRHVGVKRPQSGGTVLPRAIMGAIKRGWREKLRSLA
ncbi:protein of unknown function [Burkholderia multivorans]